MRHLMIRLLPATFCALAVGGQACVAPQAPSSVGSEGTSVASRSKSWSVRLISAERRDTLFEGDKQERRARPGHYVLRVSLALEYVGPAARLRPPPVQLVDNQGVRFERVPSAVGERNTEIKPNDNFLKTMWFATGFEKDVAVGEAMPAEIWFDFELPDSAQDLQLAFADVEPIKLPR